MGYRQYYIQILIVIGKNIDDKLFLFVIISGGRREFWGCSSVGRATVLHAVGQRFESAHLHQKTQYIFFTFLVYTVIKKNSSSNNKKFVIFEIYVLMSAQCLSNQ